MIPHGKNPRPVRMALDLDAVRVVDTRHPIVQRRSVFARTPPELGPVVLLRQPDITDTAEALSGGEASGVRAFGIVQPMHAAAVSEPLRKT